MSELPGYECFAVGLITVQHYPLAVGGICLRGSAKRWQDRVRQLEKLHILRHDLYGIDYALAKELVKLGDDTLIVAGASICTGDSFGPGRRSGGVIGSPHQEILSSDGGYSPLSHGFCLYTVPGGPGIAALCPETQIEKIAASVISGRHRRQSVIDAMRDAEAPIGLVVFDGTGADTEGGIITVTGSQAVSISLKAIARSAV